MEAKTNPKKWKEINAVYHRSKTGGGAWEFHKKCQNNGKLNTKN